MGVCQHCGQGAIGKDANGFVCPDCWDDGYFELSPRDEATEMQREAQRKERD